MRRSRPTLQVRHSSLQHVVPRQAESPVRCYQLRQVSCTHRSAKNLRSKRNTGDGIEDSNDGGGEDGGGGGEDGDDGGDLDDG